MSEWTDSEGRSLGTWVACTEQEYLAGLSAMNDPVVHAGRTQVGESLSPTGWGEPYQDRHISSEWGERDASHPQVRCEDDWDYFGERHHAHYRFVPADHLVPHGPGHSIERDWGNES